MDQFQVGGQVTNATLRAPSRSNPTWVENFK